MNIITIHASKSYDIHIGSGLLSQLGVLCHQLGGVNRACIVSDTNVHPLYGNIVRSSLSASGFETHEFIFPAGEANKNGQTYLALLNHLAKSGLNRNDLLIALGGGVVGDMTGFAAATYLRGIRFVQLPTTLLSAVDSSVGGKTGIDLPEGKNLAGAFFQPSLVVCDVDTLHSLPREDFLDGCAEVIKYSVLYDPKLFQHLEQYGPDFHREAVIQRCVELKRDVVIKDEYDTGMRMKLNLGHTIGHSIERCSDYTISHGKAVAMGMSIVSRSCGCPDAQRILALIKQFDLPTDPPFHADELCQHTLRDKKRSADVIKMILPKAIGNCSIVPIPVDQMLSFIQAGL